MLPSPPLLVDRPWPALVGHQRDWVWRGWQTRYAFWPGPPESQDSPLLLLHGFGASIGHWRRNMPVWARDRPVYALDLLGFGASRKVEVAYDAFLWAQQVYDFWQALIGEPVVLVGNSVGSLVALTVADRFPAAVQAVVAMSLPDPSMRDDLIPAPLRRPIAMVERLVAAPWVLKVLFYGVRRPGFVQRWAGFAYGSAAAVDAELVEILCEPSRDRGAAETFARLIPAMTRSHFGPPVRQVLARLSVPFLLLWGTADGAIPFALAERLLEYCPSATFVALEGAGHCPHDQVPEQVNSIISEWLDQLATR